ncbi:e3 ubiquitin-protein ligase RNF168-like protein [Anopheles sinensis]|uniref:E3 ubiquitin-protein ligase RNF168-like protein n=1 Tax=Anopheles sinensis TaxID=74873 RepID=A0A084VM07_ANOSI|nr:e3 ubiquitin-protein ligase RNF168-like protein [Anopheles sinensis]
MIEFSTSLRQKNGTKRNCEQPVLENRLRGSSVGQAPESSTGPGLDVSLPATCGLDNGIGEERAATPEDACDAFGMASRKKRLTGLLLAPMH